MKEADVATEVDVVTESELKEEKKNRVECRDITLMSRQDQFLQKSEVVATS